MRLDWLRANQASARRATALLAILLAVSMLATLLLAAHTVRQAGRERVVVVPPAIHKTFWVEAERASPEYLEQMGYFPAQLTLNVTPKVAVRSRVTARTAESFPLSHQLIRQVLVTPRQNGFANSGGPSPAIT